MGRYAQFVVGPAGSGKSTLCFAMQNHMLANTQRLPPRVINLDPGQERTAEEEKEKPFDLDVRDLISVSDVVEELGFGPNGALVFAMEHLVQNMDWLQEGLDSIGGSDDEYFIFDCPGQIELYTHIPVLRTVIERLQEWNILVCVVHVIDALFIDDTSKFVSGALLSLTSMLQLQSPTVNVITKCDIKKNTRLGGRPRRPDPFGSGRIHRYSPWAAMQDPDAAFEALANAEVEHESAREGALQQQEAQQQNDLDEEEGAFLDVRDPEYFNPDPLALREGLQQQAVSERFRHLSESICTVLENYNLVHYLPLDITDEESIDMVLMQIDNATQYGEDLEPRAPAEEADEDDAEVDA